MREPVRSDFSRSHARMLRKRRARHVWLRRAGSAALVVLAVIVVLVGVSGAALYSQAKDVKAQASEIMVQASVLKVSLKEGNAGMLSDSVASIVSKTDAINGTVNSFLWDAASYFPVLGEDISSVQALGQAVDDMVDDALVPISQSLAGKKLSDLLQNGRVDIELIRSVSSAINEALPTMQSSLSVIEGLPQAHMSQVQEVLDKVQEPVGEAGELIDAVQPMLNVLPQMFGADGQTRRYLIIAQNNAELRSTGGLPGSWGVLTVTDGVISMDSDFTSILHQDGLAVYATDEELQASGTNIDTDPAQVNCIPDFPRVGQMCRDYWSQAGYGEMNGVIAIDPIFLQRLLALTGGFTASDGTFIDGTNAAAVLLCQTYWRLGDDPDAQDAYFAEVASDAFKTVMANLGSAGFKDLWDVITFSGQDGRLLAWMADEQEQSVMGGLGISGALSTDPSIPVLGVYENDETWSKMDWYASIKTQVGEGVANEDGTITYEVVTTLTNTMTQREADTAPAYIYGYNHGKFSVDDMMTRFMFYAPAGGWISDMTIDNGNVYDQAEATHAGLQVLRYNVHTQLGQTTTFSYRVTASAQAAQALSVKTTPLAQEALM